VRFTTYYAIAAAFFTIIELIFVCKCFRSAFKAVMIVLDYRDACFARVYSGFAYIAGSIIPQGASTMTKYVIAKTRTLIYNTTTRAFAK